LRLHLAVVQARREAAYAILGLVIVVAYRIAPTIAGYGSCLANSNSSSLAASGLYPDGNGDFDGLQFNISNLSRTDVR